jgi:hypothetical protein
MHCILDTVPMSPVGGPTTDVPLRRGAPIRSISAVLPARDEAQSIVSVVDATLDALSDVVPEYQVIIVDDASRDATARLADELALRHPEVRVIHHPKRRGYGAAWRSGIEAASKQYTFLMDADRQYNPAELTHLVQWDDRYDLVAGYRLRRHDPLPRRLLGWCFTLTVRLLFGVKMRDATCGFLLARTSLLKRLPLESTSSLIRTELLFRAQQRQAQLREVGVRHYPRRAGRAKGPLALLRTLRDLVALRRRITKERQASLWTPPPAPDTGETLTAEARRRGDDAEITGETRD